MHSQSVAHRPHPLRPAARTLLLLAGCLLTGLSARAAHYADLTADALTVGPGSLGTLAVNGTATISGTLDVGNDVDVIGVVTANSLSSLGGVTFGSAGNATLTMSGNTVQFNATSSAGNWTWQRSGGSATQMTLGVDGTLTLFDPSTSKQLVLNPNGVSLTNVTTSGTASTPAISFAGDADTGIFSTGANLLQFATNGTEQLRIDINGNVGVGTSSPLTRLHVSTPVSTNATAFMLSATSSSVDWKFDIGNKFGLSSRSLAIYSSNNTAADFAINPSGGSTPPLVVTSGGNVGIGVIGPTARLQVKSAGNNWYSAVFGNSFHQTIVRIDADPNVSGSGNYSSAELQFSRNMGSPIMSLGFDYANSTSVGVGVIRTGTTSSLVLRGGPSPSHSLMIAPNSSMALGNGTPTSVPISIYGEAQFLTDYPHTVVIAVNATGNVSVQKPLAISGNTTFSGNTTTSFGANTTLTISGTTSFSGNNTVTGNTTTTFGENTTVNFNGTVRFGEAFGDISMGDFGE